jgi:chitin disaccharide deacetylase
MGDAIRRLIVHADDIGMCHATVEAFAALATVGYPISASVMAPCPWLPAVAAVCQAHPDADIGAHLTLTCEYQSYRWRPLTAPVPAAGLTEADGTMPPSPVAIWERADPGAALAEAQAQLNAIRSVGITVSHLDVHMAAFEHPRLLPELARWAAEVGLPLRHTRPAVPQETDNPWPAAGHAAAELLVRAGLALPSAVVGLPLDSAGDRNEQARVLLAGLPPGLSVLIAHPASDTPELRAIASDWAARVADFALLSSAVLPSIAAEEGIELITYRDL